MTVMNEFFPEQPQAARQFSSNGAESHAAWQEESGLSIEPKSPASVGSPLYLPMPLTGSPSARLVPKLRLGSMPTSKQVLTTANSWLHPPGKALALHPKKKLAGLFFLPT